MPNKKKGKKKGAAASKTQTASRPSPACAAPSEAIPIQPLNDVYRLLFNNDQIHEELQLPFIGPIAVSMSSLADHGGDDVSPTTGTSMNDNVEVVHGRGLIASRDVSVGECLFVIPSVLSSPVKGVHRRFMERMCTSSNDVTDDSQFDVGSRNSSRNYGKELEEIAESVLVELVHSLLNDTDSTNNRDSFQEPTIQSFLSQMSSEHVPQVQQLDVLLANPSATTENQSTTSSSTATLDDETILNTIRRNAFGPDYHNYDTIAKYWMDNMNSANTTTASATSTAAYNRLLGVYPLAAMINHSCTPNAVRIFGNIPIVNSNTNDNTDSLRGREVMIVHANAPMKKGTEITWSYLPPTTPHRTRQEILQSKYGFACRCRRCACEEKAMEGIQLFRQLNTAAATTSSINTYETLSLPDMIQSLENCLTSHPTINNEAMRYIRVGYASLYMQYFNMALSSIHNNVDNGTSSSSSITIASNILQLATQLHFSFVSCNNASTEHISILHLCYELASLLHTRSSSSNNSNNIKNTMAQIKFWTEQLKQAHMIRYGALGENLECVRKVMKHSRLVLRNRNGWYMVEDRFI